MTQVNKSNAKSGKVRIQLDLLRAQAEMFDGLADECGLETRKELFNVAMTLFHWAVKETKSGRKVASYDPSTDAVETVVMPALEFVRRGVTPQEHATSALGRSVSEDQPSLSLVGKGEAVAT